MNIFSLIQANIIYPNKAFEQYQGVGMTSQRTRNRLIERLQQLGITDTKVLETMQVIPRHLFLDEAMASRSYEDTALPIGFGQTISQPWIVAKMTQWLFAESHTKPVQKVLEIGTGSGYQTAILALLADHIFTVERIAPLSIRAKEVLNTLCLYNIDYRISDGYWGWPHKHVLKQQILQNQNVHSAPLLFDAIISAASPATVPLELFQQLKLGGRLVMPIGKKKQGLYGFIKTESGMIEEFLGEVMFVPMKQGIEN
ncbi:Protein-L-isoaspartate O-methyltransferase [hydrothermal vent metagenome]|uniref:protein-L-isoaspartate(D-aspartate) O-methyltransferase n=1 Tax=hydrothermal vent metagenome TaxID=652676 RepID=A0A3B0WBM6_9ZZZZ